MLRDNVDPRDHHRVAINTQAGLIGVAQLWLKDVPDAQSRNIHIPQIFLDYLH